MDAENRTEFIKNLLDGVSLAGVRFYPGLDYHKAEDEWKSGHNAGVLYSPEKYNTTVYTFLEDPLFPEYVANLIPDSKLIAAIGPTCKEAVARFFLSTVFNEQRPVSTIVCFSTHQNLSKKDPDGLSFLLRRDDFFDYFSREECISYSSESITISAVATFAKKSDNIEHYKLTVSYENTNKTLNVYFYLTPDGHPFQPKTLADLKIADEVMHIAQTEYVLTHCHAGVGRTGSFILQNLLNANFASVIDFSSVSKSIENILALLARIRKVRPIFIHSSAQLQAAVMTAFQIYTNNLLDEVTLSVGVSALTSPAIKVVTPIRVIENPTVIPDKIIKNWSDVLEEMPLKFTLNKEQVKTLRGCYKLMDSLSAGIGDGIVTLRNLADGIGLIIRQDRLLSASASDDPVKNDAGSTELSGELSPILQEIESFIAQLKETTSSCAF